MTEKIPARQGIFALSPLIVFLMFYAGMSIHEGDFYQIPIMVSFLVACVYSFIITRPKYIASSLSTFCNSAGKADVILMIMIFIISGAFATTAREMGSVDSIVKLTLSILPGQMILPGLFLASCLVSLSIGTSVGTIAALTPISVGMSEQISISPSLLAAVVVGGSFFGDNLSFISDTTIIATKTQGCQLADKFRSNIRIALPAAALTVVIYLLFGVSTTQHPQLNTSDFILILPYLFVLVTAIVGINVITVLIIGTILAGATGLLTDTLTLNSWMTAINHGILNMSQLIVVTILAAGLMGIIRSRGGIIYLMQRITSRIHGQRAAQFSIAAMVMFADICTANNTIAILTVAPLAREISEKYHISARRAASLLDTSACFTQGLLPYGAQLLIAAGLASLNPIDIIPYLYYPFILGTATIISILINYEKDI